MRASYITHHHILSPLGSDSEANFNNLIAQKKGIKKHTRKNGESHYSSIIDKEKVDEQFCKISDINLYTPLEKMMILSVYELLAISNFNITDKTGLIVSTTKGNIDVLSPDSKFHNNKNRVYLSELGRQIQYFFNFKNEAIIISNACVSGLLAVSVADRLIKSNKYDEVIVVSGDLVTEFIISGFNSFQAISDKPCKPYSKNRSGITIGEAVASVLMSATFSKSSDSTVQVIGSGSYNDANHISGPSRTGEGLYLSIKSAIKEAKIEVGDIDYISAHGTATHFNDEMEAIAFKRLGMLDIPMNSLKGYFGHTLGASGLLESIIGMKSLENNRLIASMGFDELGVSQRINVIEESEQKELHSFLKTASGFGGCNTAVLFKKIVSK